MKKILVTWWAWFIWSHLCRRLLLKWHEVICMDNLYTSDRSNIYDLIWNPRFSFVLWDVSQPFSVQVDEIYNLACPNSPFSYVKNPVETIKTVIQWTINMLELANKVKAKVLIASSSKVYWENLETPPDENYIGKVDHLSIFGCYSESKRMAETICYDYQQEYSVDVRIARIFPTYGPNMYINDGKVITDFIVRALKNKKLYIYWDGSLIRSLMYIDDLVDWLIELMTNDKDFSWPVNFGVQETITVKQLWEKILSLIPNSKSKIIYESIDNSDMPFIPTQYPAKIDMAKAMLWRSPKVKLDYWLKKTIDYFKAQSY